MPPQRQQTGASSQAGGMRSSCTGGTTDVGPYGDEDPLLLSPSEISMVAEPVGAGSGTRAGGRSEARGGWEAQSSGGASGAGGAQQLPLGRESGGVYDQVSRVGFVLVRRTGADASLCWARGPGAHVKGVAGCDAQESMCMARQACARVRVIDNPGIRIHSTHNAPGCRAKRSGVFEMDQLQEAGHRCELDATTPLCTTCKTLPLPCRTLRSQAVSTNPLFVYPSAAAAAAAQQEASVTILVSGPGSRRSSALGASAGGDWPHGEPAAPPRHISAFGAQGALPAALAAAGTAAAPAPSTPQQTGAQAPEGGKEQKTKKPFRLVGLSKKLFGWSSGGGAGKPGAGKDAAGDGDAAALEPRPISVDDVVLSAGAEAQRLTRQHQREGLSDSEGDEAEDEAGAPPLPPYGTNTVRMQLPGHYLQAPPAQLGLLQQPQQSHNGYSPGAAVQSTPSSPMAWLVERSSNGRRGSAAGADDALLRSAAAANGAVAVVSIGPLQAGGGSSKLLMQLQGGSRKGAASFSAVVHQAADAAAGQRLQQLALQLQYDLVPALWTVAAATGGNAATVAPAGDAAPSAGYVTAPALAASPARHARSVSGPGGLEAQGSAAAGGVQLPGAASGSVVRRGSLAGGGGGTAGLKRLVTSFRMRRGSSLKNLPGSGPSAGALSDGFATPSSAGNATPCAAQQPQPAAATAAFGEPAAALSLEQLDGVRHSLELMLHEVEGMVARRQAKFTSSKRGGDRGKL